MIDAGAAPAPTLKRRGLSRIFRSLRFGYGYSLAAIVLTLLIWQAAIEAFQVPRYLLPAPTQVAVAMVESWDRLIEHSYYTLLEVLVGFAISVVVGLPLAVGIVSSRVFEKALYPLLVSSQVVPKVAIAPLFMVWFGFGMTPKILVAFLIAFFPIVIDSVVGLRSVEMEKLYLIRSMGGSSYHIFFKIRFPNALPYIFSGMKVAITLAVVGAVVGEFLGADKGIGRVLLIANGNLDTPALFAGIASLTIMGMVLFLLMDLLERLLIPWHVSRRAEHVPLGES